ncbi:Major Facilitator Superfamily protein [Streptomyces zhaozhouensis]|uniref:Major Facilitator Superfamily protein n=1 Tax=Streptomyces zhaozhouensis TaxID=1300267 RepID=A0A286E275_9ACTN|nr:MFS transporter [Streptomyces zhaozhouensis]SOD65006.1 Major Facilitator Superfamily protein [Streptomyces zhaozhouensis]
MKPTETAARGADPEEPPGEVTTSERGGPGGPAAPAPDLGPADPPAEPAGGVLSAPYRALTLGCVATVLLIAFEAMAVGTAMPAAADALDGVSLYAFAFSAFFTTSLLGMSVSGQWCDRSGPLSPVLAGIGTFALGLLLSGVAQSMWVFVAGRALQGAGGGLVIVALYVTVRLAFPERLRPAALAAFSASWVVPSMVGPVIAGTITEQLGWRWVFLGITVLVVLPLAALVPALRRAASGPPEGASRTLDRRRLQLAVAVAVGAGLLQYGGQELRWVSLLPVAVGLALLAPSAARLLPAGTFRLRRGLPSVIALRGVMSAAYLATQTFLPLLLVTQRDLSYTQAGLSLAASGATWAVGSWTQSRAWAEPHRFALVRGGTVAVTVGVGTTPLVLLDAAPVWLPMVTLAVGAFGMGLVISTVGVLVLRFSTPKEAGGNVASLQLCDSLSNVVMLTAVGSLFAALGGDATAAAGHASESSSAVDTAVGPGAFAAVYAAAFTMALLSIVVGGRLREREPAGAGLRGAT